MSGEALGGGVMVAIAAVLWVAYLMPTWSRRRHYLATERNAVRLQQTLRILAETAAVPEQVHLEANARTVAAQRKLLAQAEQEARAEAKAAEDAARAVRRAAAAAREAAAARLAAESRRTMTPSSAAVARLRRVRTVRGIASLVLLSGIVLVVAGILPIVLAGSWTMLALGSVTVALSLGALSRLARTARAARVVGVQARTAFVPAPRFEPVQLEETAPAVAHTWTPQPLPRPLHLSRGSIAQTAMASVDAAAELRKAAAEAELARRAAALVAQQSAGVTPIARPAVARAAVGAAGAAGAAGAPAPSRFASMGIVGDTAPGMADLDAVLRLRRAAG
jgi:hypothetical protein